MNTHDGFLLSYMGKIPILHGQKWDERGILMFLRTSDQCLQCICCSSYHLCTPTLVIMSWSIDNKVYEKLYTENSVSPNLIYCLFVNVFDLRHILYAIPFCMVLRYFNIERLIMAEHHWLWLLASLIYPQTTEYKLDISYHKINCFLIWEYLRDLIVLSWINDFYFHTFH